MRAVRKHTDNKWLLLYIERWLKAPVQAADGTLVSREKGSPQGSVISPLLANLFLQYGVRPLNMKYELIKKKSTKYPDRWKKFNWIMQLLIAFVGVVVVGSVSFGFYRGNQLYQKYIPLANASMEIRAEATTAYLWFEEMLGGDKSKNINEILRHLDQADWYAKSMIEGGEIDHIKLLPLNESQFRDSIKSLQGQLKEQRDLLKIRFAEIDRSGPGSEIDKQYHSTLENFVEHAKKLEMDIKEVMAHDYGIIKFISLSVVACCFFLSLVVGYGFYRYESLRQKNYLKLLQMEHELVQSEKMTSLGRMISGITHEINNPNNFITFNIPILKEYLHELIPIIDKYAEKNDSFELFGMPYKEFREDINKLLRNIESGSNRINRIVSDLKVFSQKKDDIERAWFDIKKVIGEVVTICGSKINSLVDSFEISVSEVLPQVYCDPEIVKLILVNLLTNAAEAANKKNSWIKLNVFLDKKGQKAIIIEVRDNGSGIIESNMDRIFEPFFSTKSSEGHDGMGLFLCRTLADQMGARIDLDSEVGTGSTFRLITNENERTNI